MTPLNPKLNRNKSAYELHSIDNREYSNILQKSSTGKDIKSANINGQRRHSTTASVNTVTGRPVYVRYRSRSGAKQRTKSRNDPYTAPCELLEHALKTQTEEAKDTSSSVFSRFLPLVLTWYLKWILDLYLILRGQRYNHSFLRWTISCLVITFLSLSFFAGVTLCTLHIILYLSYLVNAFIWYIFFISIVLTSFLCFILIFNYTGNDDI